MKGRGSTRLMYGALSRHLSLGAMSLGVLCAIVIAVVLVAAAAKACTGDLDFRYNPAPSALVHITVLSCFI